ncbi:NAD(P)-dependent oxidoreductase [Salipaludibacillus agaradhaerens]|jgi:3-hydroxyisobutyrate dehydrogenase-like beta-hydroxyacid dehydrogenase|uniref:NAD(P)-dependent oxidoreductase n=1 Tax=Salipaludibacillus agaradhaerens TaxID=76935 RepID=UPI0021519544|nr:NAD(P)-dependent oxidoreductase [Salipaludibacillus agaradhaerens]MCR6105464.1 NAD(P)-dependent oxidoreductase [Salipaludibacillus agaradhaerens]MCR6109549.1 NAD(P)-dependent oxidoreductase [Bacillus sp. A301a_S52]MCR6117502.1 NAD(P)-dependent oxidoreductase [Salipaludibacillus agaradhaerens]UJW56691.1 NAD(P)-dependent oxidoreductase [Bacillus sp. A116_S68]
MKVGWIGTGSLGKAVVTKMLREGERVRVFNRTAEKAVSLVKEGAILYDSPSHLALDCDIIFLCLTGHQALHDVLYEEGGILQEQKRNLIIVDISTLSPQITRETAHYLSEYNIHYLDCPVSGGPEGALAGKLTAIISGNNEAYFQAERYISLFSNKKYYVGDSGSSQTLKILNNLAEAINLLAASEVIALGLKEGFSLPTLKEVLTETRGNSIYMNILLERLMNPSKEVSASLEVRVKDLKLANELAEKNNLELLQGKLALQQFFSAERNIGKQNDQSECIKLYLKEVDINET